MLQRNWEALCKDAVAGSTWALSLAGCSPSSTTCFARFSKKGEKPRQINVPIGQQTDEAIKAEIVQKLAAFKE